MADLHNNENSSCSSKSALICQQCDKIKYHAVNYETKEAARSLARRSCSRHYYHRRESPRRSRAPPLGRVLGGHDLQHR